MAKYCCVRLARYESFLRQFAPKFVFTQPGPIRDMKDTKTAARTTTTDPGAIIAQRGEEAAKDFLPLPRGAVRLDESARTVDRAFL